LQSNVSPTAVSNSSNAILGTPRFTSRKFGRFHSARVGIHCRAVGVEAADGVVWFWIGPHAEYDKLIG
jgi:hypothetical protein